MPAPRKIDRIPAELRERLKATLAERGFGDIVAVTEDLNYWLEDAGLELTIGKTAVGEFAKLLKDQREAFSMAETLLADMDIAAEGDLHRTLMHMIAASAMKMIQAVRAEDGHLDPKDLMALGRMLKDLMQSAGLREKLLDDERKRIVEAVKAEQASKLEAAVASGDVDRSAADKARAIMGFG